MIKQRKEIKTFYEFNTANRNDKGALMYNYFMLKFGNKFRK